MRINRICINNFRIYKGLNEIDFGELNTKRNISIIAGQNGFGKTTFLTALVWGFYGKLMSEVDDKYKKEISELGGYKKYAKSILNRDIKAEKESDQKFSIEIEIADISIPSVPCNKIVILREYDIKLEKESTSILIDGFENELTKEVGSDIFINDFILPREVAKFFLFDAEKIVSLAEIKTNEEKRNLSKAYSEVLGITKYEKLKSNLENLRLKLRKKSANLSEKLKFDALQKEANQIKELIYLNDDKLDAIKSEIIRNKNLSDQYQEKLIREGNSMSVEEMVKQKELRDKLREKGIDIKSRLKDLIELAPFAIAGNKLKELHKQVGHESAINQNKINNEFVRSKFEKIKEQVSSQLKKKNFENHHTNEFIEVINEAFKFEIEKQNIILEKILLDLSSEQTNEFEAMYDNLKSSFSILFKQIVKEDKNNRIFLAKTTRKISNAETKDTDILAKRIKSEKAIVDKQLEKLNVEQNKLHEELGAYHQELASKAKVISEIAKTVRLDEMDGEKDKVIERLIKELSDFIFKFKAEKKQSLQESLKKELKRLMHKKDFIENVDVELTKDIIDIHLLGKDGGIIEKETLSKGEQQMYATALLKSLVDESSIEFPIFIDSPLQKFDKKHSNNIITKFYPTISKQVILFPLLEKELTENEYSLLTPFISQTFMIESKEGKSVIKKYELSQLFNEIKKMNNVYTH